MLSFLSGKKTIAIMGATGAQGGATVRAFQALKESGNTNFQVRAITRDPTSEKSRAIESLVDEVVQADANDEASMVEAFKDCHGAFIVTNFWEDMDAQHEMAMLRTLKEAAKKAGVKHVVLSTLEDTRGFVNEAENKDTWKLPSGYEELGMYVPHFDGKGEVTKEYEDDTELPVTTFYTTFYYENFIYFGMGPARQSESDPYAITLPLADAKMSIVAVADIGKAACAIFQDESLIGKTVGVQSDLLTGKEIADVFAKVCGLPVQYNAVPVDVYASFGFPGAEDLANMFRFFNENADSFQSLRIVGDDLMKTMGGVTKLEEWVIANKGAFDLKPAAEAVPLAAAPEATEETAKKTNPCTRWCTIS